jgi:predicted ArsR family transcriptional regulator
MSQAIDRLDETDRKLLRCLLFGRNTMDLLCDSLSLQCHQVRASLDALEATGLVRAAGDGGYSALTVELTDAGRRLALESAGPAERVLAEQRLSPDDVRLLRNLAHGTPLARQAECEWGVGATRQHLWEEGLVDVVGFIRPRAVLTERGRALAGTLEGNRA